MHPLARGISRSGFGVGFDTRGGKKMADQTADRVRRVIAMAEIAEAVELLQQGEANVDETLERIAEAMARATDAKREHRPAA
jgi:hypothetical protein